MVQFCMEKWNKLRFLFYQYLYRYLGCLRDRTTLSMVSCQPPNIVRSLLEKNIICAPKILANAGDMQIQTNQYAYNLYNHNSDVTILSPS